MAYWTVPSSANIVSMNGGPTLPQTTPRGTATRQLPYQRECRTDYPSEPVTERSRDATTLPCTVKPNGKGSAHPVFPPMRNVQRPAMMHAKSAMKHCASFAFLFIATVALCKTAIAQSAPLNDTHVSSFTIAPVNSSLRPPYPVGTIFTATCAAYSLADYNSVIDLTGGPFEFAASTTNGIVWSATSSNAVDDGNTVPVNSTLAPNGVPEAAGTVQFRQEVVGPVQYTCWYYGNIVGVEGNGTSNRVTVTGPTLSISAGGGDGSAAVPLPLWALVVLGLGLAGTLARARQRQSV